MSKYLCVSFADVAQRLQQLRQRVYQREASALPRRPDAHQQRRPDDVQKLLLRKPRDGPRGITLALKEDARFRTSYKYCNGLRVQLTTRTMFYL